MCVVSCWWTWFGSSLYTVMRAVRFSTMCSSRFPGGQQTALGELAPGGGGAAAGTGPHSLQQRLKLEGRPSRPWTGRMPGYCQVIVDIVHIDVMPQPLAGRPSFAGADVSCSLTVWRVQPGPGCLHRPGPIGRLLRGATFLFIGTWE
ncbi:hypothetical protein FQN60_004438 [Etheostoma spectabile]|uniref:Secreted protein n=1 Tax=Etheostoma spectabile TaxID=54343 RepID=A0A5J5CX74_9PERO|nr:hypothetical protein FQN60_004438 [Etheostoma spectabile]